MGGKSSRVKEKEKFKSKYIQFLRKKQRQFLNSEVRASALSLEISPLSFVTTSEDLDIDWKLFMEDYLEEHLDTCFWATKMLEFVKKEFIPSEKRWKDAIFFEKFVHSLSSSTNSEIGIDFSSYSKSILEVKMLDCESPPRGRHTTEPERVRLSPESYSDPTVKALALAVNKSLRQSQNPFRILIDHFKDYFILEFHDKSLKFSASHNGINPNTQIQSSKGKEEVGMLIRSAVVNLEYFIKLMANALALFYYSVVGSEKVRSFRELLTNSIMDITIRDDVYNILIRLVQKEHEEDEIALTTKCRQLSTLEPQHLGINEYLSLNEASPIADVITKYKEQESLLNEEEKCIVNLSVKNGTVFSEETIKNKLKIPPYQKALNQYLKIEKQNKPLKKLRTISLINTSLCKCVDDFWLGIDVDPDKLRIDSDQYISILTYIIIKAEVPNMLAHIILSNHLVSLGAKNKYNAYCLTTILACFQYLLSVEPQEILKAAKSASQSPVISSRKLAEGPFVLRKYTLETNGSSSSCRAERRRPSI